VTLALTVSCTSNVGDVEPAVKTAIALPLASVFPFTVNIVAPLALGAHPNITSKLLAGLPSLFTTVAVMILCFPAFREVRFAETVIVNPAGVVAVLASLVMMIAFAAV